MSAVITKNWFSLAPMSAGEFWFVMFWTDFFARLVSMSIKPSNFNITMAITAVIAALMTSLVMSWKLIFKGASSVADGSGEIEHPTAVEAPAAASAGQGVVHA